MELNLTEVRSFVVLAHENHYGRAASRLHVSTSCLSKRIQRLEAQLGTALVVRGPGGVVAITGPGSRFAGRAKVLVDFAQQLAASAHELVQPVVVGVPGTDGARVLRRWARRQPPAVREILKTSVCWLGVDFDSLDVVLRDQRVDVMLTAGPSSQPGVTSTRLWPMTRVGLVSTSHRMSGRRSVPVEDFAALPALRSDSAPTEWMSLWCLGDVRPLDEARMVEVAPRGVVDVLDAVAHEHGVAVSHGLVATALPPSVAPLELEGVPPAWYYAHTRGDDRRRDVQEIVRVLGAVPTQALA